MITLNGIVGIALLVGALKHHLVSFNASGSGSAVATVITLAGVTMVLPSFTTSAEGPQYSTSQLAFAAAAATSPACSTSTRTATPSTEAPEAWLSLAPCFPRWCRWSGPAKLLFPTIEEVVQDRGLPYGVVGVVIALFVLAPESIAAIRNAARDRSQISPNPVVTVLTVVQGLAYAPQAVVHLVLLAAYLFLSVQP
jgi:Ca2+:H+ antiporter